MEGRIQEARKASYPTGNALEDWKIFNLINKKLTNENLFQSKNFLRTEALKFIPKFSQINELPLKEFNKSLEEKLEFYKEKIKINKIDYYFTNSISRSSKVMSECRKIQLNQIKDGTNN